VSGSGWYVYGVVPAGEAGADVFEGAVGVDASEPVVLVADGALAAIASKVSLAEFGEGEVEERLHDPAWLEEKVRAHEAVLEAALGRTTLVPFRFGTIYRGEEQVRRMLREHAALKATLERLRGRIELGVKGYLDTERFAAAREEGGAEAQGGGGRAYLLRKQAERELADAREAFKGECALEAHERLSTAADDARANPPHRPEVSGRPGEMFLNAAYLIAPEGQERVRSVLGELESRHSPHGVWYELTGPWPPYNFVEEEDE
jgi:hypothetical protein